MNASAKRAEIVKYAEEVKADVICIQETNLRKGQTTPSFTGWEEAGRSDRTRRREGPTLANAHGHGGVLTLVREGSGIAHSGMQYNLRDPNSEATLVEVTVG